MLKFGGAGSRLLLGAARGAPVAAQRGLGYQALAQHQVMVSQSPDPLANIALEDWVLNNINLQEGRNVLILSNNLKNNSRQIKASFIGQRDSLSAADPASLVVGSLPAQLALASLPRVSSPHHSGAAAAEEEDVEVVASGYYPSLVVEFGVQKDEDPKTILSVMETIGKRFLATLPPPPAAATSSSSSSVSSFSRLSLVRPDDGWFPGIDTIRRDMAVAAGEIAAIRAEKWRQGGRHHCQVWEDEAAAVADCDNQQQQQQEAAPLQPRLPRTPANTPRLFNSFGV